VSPAPEAILTSHVTGFLRRVAGGAAIPAGYFALALAASWPLARDFATCTVGEVHYDERHAIWILWYTAQALAGRVSWPDTTHLLWPHGISLLIDGVGPLNAIAALPFWPWGAAAAFNGAALAGLALSGWCLYALARGIGLARGPAFVAGMLFLLWPIHLLGLVGHLEKLFVGMLPLTLLGGLRAFDPQRGRAWLVAPGVGLLGALLQNGNQFTFAALGVALVGVQTWWVAPPAERPLRMRRMLVAAVAALAICGPLLAAILRVMRDPTLNVALAEVSFYYSPDALSLVLPGPHQWWAGWLYPDRRHVHDFVWASALPALNPTPTWYGTGLETAVGIPLVAIALCVCGWRARAGRGWILFGLAFAVLCLGSPRRNGGVVTPVRLPIALPRVPEFYRQLAADRSGGAVLDLPHGGYAHSDFASAYMYYQTVHRHPIAWSYLSRSHLRHPNEGLEGLWHADVPAGAALRDRLRALGYRYVVVHRRPDIFLGGRVEHARPGLPQGPPAPLETERLIRDAFSGEPPVHVEDLVAVWSVR
jgi:hypothetical protein